MTPIAIAYARKIHEIQQHPYAIEVLEHWSLHPIADESFLELVNMNTDKPRASDIRLILKRFNTMTLAIAPIADGLVKPITNRILDSEGMASFVLDFDDEVNANDLARTIELALRLFRSTSELRTGTATEGQIVSIQTGSGVRIDIKGVADTVDALKRLVTEIWRVARHTKAEQYEGRVNAIKTGLNTLQEITNAAQNGSIDQVDADRLQNAVISDTLRLFDQGVELSGSEFPETLNNHSILADRRRQLLIAAAASEAASDRAEEQSKARTKKNTAKKRTKKTP